MVDLAIFDFDGTLFTEETIPFLIKTFRRSDIFRTSWKVRFRYYKTVTKMLIGLACYKIKVGPFKEKEHFRKIMTQWFLGVLDQVDPVLVDAYFVESAKLMASHFNQRVVDAVKMHRDQGLNTVIVSGCYEPILKALPIAHMFDTILGTPIKRAEGYIDLKSPLVVTAGTRKWEVIREHWPNNAIDWEASFAYGDSIYDIHVLEKVGNPIAVNPDSKLKALSTSRGWKIL